MSDDHESLVQQAMKKYGEHLGDIQTPSKLLHLAERRPTDTAQIELLKIAIEIATGIGAFSRNQPADNTTWQSRQ